ncbi:hypothetical protein B4164_2067 [Bacillus licheniformis]|nr:hypothetical protein B4164_2067 [Bacillus licheniformis]
MIQTAERTSQFYELFTAIFPGCGILGREEASHCKDFSF